METCGRSGGRFEVDCESVPTFLDDAPRTFRFIVAMRSICGLDPRSEAVAIPVICCYRFY